MLKHAATNSHVTKQKALLCAGLYICNLLDLSSFDQVSRGRMKFFETELIIIFAHAQVD